MSGRELPVAPAACSLDAEGMAEQGARWDALLPAVTRIARSPRQVVAEFGPELDEGLLLEAVEVERGCCPFFDIDWDRDVRRLRFAVSEREHEPALEAVADGLASR
jgi:hypothetical protein